MPFAMNTIWTFSNDMVTFGNADDVLTLLIHLGYLGYDFNTKEVFIPNEEILHEYHTSIPQANPSILQSLNRFPPCS